MSDDSNTARVDRLATVMVPVSDQDKGIEFYRDRLGFEVRADIPMGRGERWVEVAPPAGETTVALVRPREGEPVGIDAHLALGTRDIDGDHARLLAAGVDVDEAVMRMGDPVPPMFFFRDQDANNLLLVQRD
jgi:catechol 2,3-dioxygenase-like lactoylglutathione lyase family enzyme